MAAAASPPSAPERLASILEWLCTVVAAHGIRGVITAPLLFLLWRRLRRAAIRVRLLAARFAAGQPLTTPRRPAAPRRTRQPPQRLPGGYAWLVRAVPGAACGASQLRSLLANPEMAELAQAPAMRRVLRPLCQLLGVRPPPIPKPAAPVAAAPPKPSVRPASATVPDAPAGSLDERHDSKPPSPLTQPLAA